MCALGRIVMATFLVGPVSKADRRISCRNAGAVRIMKLSVSESEHPRGLAGMWAHHRRNNPNQIGALLDRWGLPCFPAHQPWVASMQDSSRVAD